MCRGRFYTGVISQYQQKRVSKESVGLKIPRIKKMITIWGEVFFKLRVSFDELGSRKKVLLESSNSIETHIDVVVEVLEVHISVTFGFCIDGEFVEF